MKLEQLIEKLEPHEYEKFMAQVAEYRGAVDREKAQDGFMNYVKMMWPGFVSGRHHALMAKKFEDIANGKIKRAIINMPPRHTKSEFASYLLPSWFLGKFPNKKVIQCSNTADLAVGFGRKVRNLVGSEQYAKVFPNVALRQDSKAAGRWATNGGGEYFAIGVGGTVTGKGADLLIIDDPHSEQEAALAAGDPSVYDKVYEWYTSGPRQRLQPGGSIVIVMTRWGDRDLTGRVIKDAAGRDKGEEWEIIELPAIISDHEAADGGEPEDDDIGRILARETADDDGERAGEQRRAECDKARQFDGPRPWPHHDQHAAESDQGRHGAPPAHDLTQDKCGEHRGKQRRGKQNGGGIGERQMRHRVKLAEHRDGAKAAA